MFSLNVNIRFGPISRFIFYVEYITWEHFVVLHAPNSIMSWKGRDRKSVIELQKGHYRVSFECSWFCKNYAIGLRRYELQSNETFSLITIVVVVAVTFHRGTQTEARLIEEHTRSQIPTQHS